MPKQRNLRHQLWYWEMAWQMFSSCTNTLGNVGLPACSVFSPPPDTSQHFLELVTDWCTVSRTLSGSLFCVLSVSCIFPWWCRPIIGLPRCPLCVGVEEKACLCHLIGHQGQGTRGSCWSESREATLVSVRASDRVAFLPSCWRCCYRSMLCRIGCAWCEDKIIRCR